MSHIPAIRLIWSMSPEASLTATMFPISLRRAMVSGSMFLPVREGTL